MDPIELLSTILPLIATFGVILVLFINLYIKIRSKFPVSVNCWFCNRWLKVAYGLQNSWDCPHCEQYNGFNSDGDYNKPIPAQHDELMNKAVPFKEKQTLISENGLCNICNNNQRLKIHQLAVFSPIDESNFDEEIERYKEQLERAYRLCPQCEKTVKLTLHKQKSFLLGQRLSNLRSQGLSLFNLSILNSGKFTAKRTIFINTIKYLTILLAVVQLIENIKKIDFTKNYQKTLPKNLLPYLLFTKDFFIFLFNVFSTITEYFYYLYSFTILNNGLFIYLQKYVFDFNHLISINVMKLYFSAILEKDRCFLVSCMGLSLELLILKVGYNLGKLTSFRCVAWIFNVLISYVSLSGITPSRQILDMLQIFSSCFLIFFTSSTNVQSNKHTEKTSPLKNKTETTSATHDTTLNNSDPIFGKPEQTNSFKTPKLNSSFSSSRSISPISSSAYTDCGFAFFKSPNDSHIFGQKAIFENPLTTSHFKFAQNYRSGGLDDSFSSQKSFFSEPLNVSDETIKLNSSFNSSFSQVQDKKAMDFELGEELNKLHLGSYTNLEKYSGGVPATFKIMPSLRPKPVLSPPKLHNVTQSSWVAGGYWKSPNDYMNNFNSFSNLSRSSSQSSGFGSQTSSQNLNNIDVFNSLPPSRNTSICGEFDKFSVFSEPPYYNSVKNSSYHNRFYPVMKNDQPIYICPRVQNTVKNTNEFSNEHSFRPSSCNSLFSQPLSHQSGSFKTQKNIDAFSSNRTFSPLNSTGSAVIYKPNNLNYVKGSLLQKWRDHNIIKTNDC